jgi:fatty-acyl-CoA synthase
MTQLSRDDACFEPLSPVLLLARTVRVFPRRTAVVYGSTRMSYADLGHSVGQMAGALHRAGISRGDRVAMIAPNTPWHLAAHFALPLLQAPLVSINTRLAAPEIAHILAHSGSRILMVDADLLPPLAGVLAGIDTLERVVVLSAPGAPELPDMRRPALESYETFVEGAPVLPLESALADENAVISINYTSGTTGSPKGVMFTHRGAYLNAVGQLGTLSLTKETVFLWTLPMFHCNGWCMPWAVSAAAGTHVCIRRIDPPEIFDLIEKHGVTHLNGAPTVLLMVSSHPAAEGRRFSPPLRVCTGGAPPSPTLLGKMENLGVRITHIYGLTETYGPHVLCEMQPEWESLDVDGRAQQMARQGVPYSHATFLRVVDADMNDVPADGQTMGEVVMRGNNVMLGYYRDPEATAKAFSGGWFHSGDVGVMHADGYIELRDRSKDIIISGGENISTIEVENMLYTHPDVLEVAVVGVPDARYGEVPKAFVTLRPGARATGDELIAYTRDRMTHFKCPKHVEICDLPKTATGKIQKFRLREKEWAGYDKRVQG